MTSALPADPRARLQELRARHPRFIFEKTSLDRVTGPDRLGGQGIWIHFHFRLEPDIEFKPRIWIRGLPWNVFEALPATARENFLFHLGLIEMLSYWKAACSPEIVVQAEALNDDQIAWWTDLLHKGMGEYFYVNQIDWRAHDFFQMHSVPLPLTAEDRFGNDLPAESRVTSRESRDLVLTSGGKDSVVTLETLRAVGRPFDCLLLNPTQAALDVAKQAGCERPILVHRTIDKRLLELNAAGYFNGHTPFSALLAFLGVTVAALFGHRRVIVSNERSAEEATVEYLGEPINHQHSKTFEFETSFRDYSRKYLAPDIEYFSLLRPLYELQIAQRFAKYPAYFPLFRSCNRGQATNSWCGRCPKCIFVWTVLYPFIEREQMLGIFAGRDLFEWEGAADLLCDLLGLNAAKPFECVGTKEETLAALHLCVERYRAQNRPLPASLNTIAQSVLASRSDLPALAQRVLSSWSDQHHLPAELGRQISDTLRDGARF
jgi:hypothetical protein